MKDIQVQQSVGLVIAGLVQYTPNSVVSKSIIRALTGSITVMAFDSGEGISEKTSAFDTFIQVIEGKSEIVIDGVSTILDTGQSIIVPAHRKNLIKANERCKMISTVIKSGYDMFNDYEIRQLSENKFEILPIDPELEPYKDGLKESLEKHLKRERDTDFRNKYRTLYGGIIKCASCELMAKNVFGLDDPNSFLELHNIEPLKPKKETSKKTSKDVSLLCPNCHKAIHRMMIENDEATITIKDIKKKFNPELLKFFMEQKVP